MLNLVGFGVTPSLQPTTPSLKICVKLNSEYTKSQKFKLERPPHEGVGAAQAVAKKKPTNRMISGLFWCFFNEIDGNCGIWCDLWLVGLPQRIGSFATSCSFQKQYKTI